MDICLLQAKRTIALNWKNSQRPSIKRWFHEMSVFLPLEKITYTLKDKQDLFHSIWKPFIQYLRDNDLSSLLEEDTEK